MIHAAIAARSSLSPTLPATPVTYPVASGSEGSVAADFAGSLATMLAGATAAPDIAVPTVLAGMLSSGRQATATPGKGLPEASATDPLIAGLIPRLIDATDAVMDRVSPVIGPMVDPAIDTVATLAATPVMLTPGSLPQATLPGAGPAFVAAPGQTTSAALATSALTPVPAVADAAVPVAPLPQTPADPEVAPKPTRIDVRFSPLPTTNPDPAIERPVRTDGTPAPPPTDPADDDPAPDPEPVRPDAPAPPPIAPLPIAERVTSPEAPVRPVRADRSKDGVATIASPILDTPAPVRGRKSATGAASDKDRTDPAPLQAAVPTPPLGMPGDLTPRAVPPSVTAAAAPAVTVSPYAKVAAAPAPTRDGRDIATPSGTDRAWKAPDHGNGASVEAIVAPETRAAATSTTATPVMAIAPDATVAATIMKAMPTTARPGQTSVATPTPSFAPIGVTRVDRQPVRPDRPEVAPSLPIPVVAGPSVMGSPTMQVAAAIMAAMPVQRTANAAPNGTMPSTRSDAVAPDAAPASAAAAPVASPVMAPIATALPLLPATSEPTRWSLPAATAPVTIAAAQVPLQPRAGTVASAAQVFGAAMQAVAAPDDRAPTFGEGQAGLSALVATQAAAPVAAVTQAPLDMRQERWPEAMIARIELLRDAADATDTRIRLVPDALGTIDVSVKRDGDAVRVHFTAEQAATRTLLQDAQPRLADLAETRGLKLAQSGVDGSQGGQAGQQQRQPATPPSRLPAAPPRAAVTTDAETDSRLA